METGNSLFFNNQVLGGRGSSFSEVIPFFLGSVKTPLDYGVCIILCWVWAFMVPSLFYVP